MQHLRFVGSYSFPSWSSKRNSESDDDDSGDESDHIE